MSFEDAIESGGQLLSRAVYFETALGEKIRPIYQRDAISGERSYRVYPVGNSKDTHVQVFDAAELADYAEKGVAIRCRLPNGRSSNRSINSKDIEGRLIVLPEVRQKIPLGVTTRRSLRLPASTLRMVTADFIWASVQELLAGAEVPGFGPSTDYDLIADNGVRLPPKQVFGLAASKALGESISPSDFSGGLRTVCFEQLNAAGYEIVAKGEQPTALHLPLGSADYSWTEGRQKLAVHVHKERARGLSQAKKAEFVKMHGKLFCESCLLDPVATYGEHGTSCIEVHHHDTAVGSMQPGHLTLLEHLRCLCANCHRVEHQRLRLENA